MSVFDKELIINGKAIRSPEQQVWKNMKDIEALQDKIKDAYKTSETLTSASVSVATADTNVGTAEEGWLMTEDGLLFKITGNDGDNVLLQFYADLKGPQGETGPSGASLEIDDTGTSATKVWSSQKTNSKIELISDKGIYYTLVQPTLDGDVYKLNVSDLGNDNTYTWQKYGDLIIYIDGNGNPTELWKCVGLNGTHTVMTVEKIADYSKGKQLYQHNIVIGTTTSKWLMFSITNDSNIEFTISSLWNYFTSKGITEFEKGQGVFGVWSGTMAREMHATANTNEFSLFQSGTTIVNMASETITDNVIPL